MAISSKKQLNNKYFTQSSGDTFVLSGDTVISGRFRYAEGKTPTGATDFITKEYFESNSGSTLSFTNGLTRTGDNVELGGVISKPLSVEVSADYQLKGAGISYSNLVTELTEKTNPLSGATYDVIINLFNRLTNLRDNDEYVVLVDNNQTYVEDKINNIGFYITPDNLGGFSGIYLSNALRSFEEGPKISLLTEQNYYIRNNYNNRGFVINEIVILNLDNRISQRYDLSNLGFSGDTYLNDLYEIHDFIFDGINELLLVSSYDNVSIYNHYLINLTTSGVTNLNLDISTNFDRNKVRFMRSSDGVNPSFTYVEPYIGLLTSNNYISYYNYQTNTQLISNTIADLLIQAYYETGFGGEVAFIYHDIIDSNALKYISFDETNLNTILYQDQGISPTDLLDSQSVDIILNEPKYIINELLKNNTFKLTLRKNNYNSIVRKSIDGQSINIDLNKNINIYNTDLESENYNNFEISENFPYPYIYNSNVDNLFLHADVNTSFNISLTSSGFTYPSTYTNPNVDGLITRRVLSGQTINNYTSYSANTENIAGADAFNDLKNDVNTISGSTNTFSNGLTETNGVVELGGVILKDTEILSTKKLSLNGNTEFNIKSNNYEPILSNPTFTNNGDKTIVTTSKDRYSGMDRIAVLSYDNGNFNTQLTFIPDASTPNPIIFESGLNPSGWTGNTIGQGSSFVGQEIYFSGRYMILYELDYINAEIDVIIINTITQSITRLKQLLPVLDNYNYNTNNFASRRLLEICSVIPQEVNPDDFFAFFYDENTGIVHHYDSSLNNISTIQSGDTVSGATTIIPSFIRVTFLSTRETDVLGDEYLLLETNSLNKDERYLKYSFSNNTCSYITLSISQQDFDGILSKINISNKIFLSSGKSISPFGGTIEYFISYVTDNYLIQFRDSATVVYEEFFDQIIENDFKFGLGANTPTTETSFNFSNIGGTRYFIFVEFNKNKYYSSTFPTPFGMGEETFFIYSAPENKVITNLRFTKDGNSVTSDLSSIIIYDISENNFTVSPSVQGFQYPSSYVPTQQTSLLTLGNRNETSNKIVTGSTTLTNSDHTVFVDSSGSTLTVTLVAAPKDGLVYTIKDATGNASTNPITIDGNGKTIDGQTSITINIDYYGFELTYSATLDAWLITNTINY